MTSSISVTHSDDFDVLPRPEMANARDISVSGLTRPVSSVPSIADSGRISFGAGFRLRLSK